jgi:hypothetical protein
MQKQNSERKHSDFLSKNSPRMDRFADRQSQLSSAQLHQTPINANCACV